MSQKRCSSFIVSILTVVVVVVVVIVVAVVWGGSIGTGRTWCGRYSPVTGRRMVVRDNKFQLSIVIICYC